MDALNESERLKDHCLLSTVDRNTVLDRSIIIILEVRSLARHRKDVLNDTSCLNKDIVGFTEPQMKSSESTSIIYNT